MNLAASAYQTLTPFVRVVVGAHKDGEVKFVGSSFLLNHKGKVFLITAAHVLECHNGDHQLFIDSTNEGFARIYGDAIVSNSTTKRHSDDKVDTAIVCLEQDTANKLSKTPMLCLENFDVNYNQKYDKGFVVIGYPVSQNKRNIIATNFEAKLYGFHAVESPQEKYSKLNVDRSQHIVLDFDREKVFSQDNETRRAYGLVGISGSPVWGINANGKCKVVSLFVEHHEEDINAALTTKVGGILTKIFR